MRTQKYNIEHFNLFLLVLLSILQLNLTVFAQDNPRSQTNTSFLKENAARLYRSETSNHLKAISVATQHGWKTAGTTQDGKVFMLYALDDFGLPLYKVTESNKTSAATINTNKLYQGGSLGLNLSGSTLAGDRVAIWDGAAVLTTHVEFQQNRVEVKDGTSSSSSHSTHVAGTIMAAGKYENARGMAFGLPKLLSFDFNNDNSEMSTYAANLLLSNHSYGTIAGWFENTSVSPTRWEFMGQFGANEDYKFGYYDSDAKAWDQICFYAPYYLPVKSGGNYRDSNGPAVGATYYRYNAGGNLINAGPRPAGISSNDGYDILGTYAVAKNIMTVAAVNPLPFGTTSPSDITISSFSAWGPTDDGRIKPDIAADGVNVTSTTNTSADAYATLSGTSMAAPSVTGSMALLQELYLQKNNNFMRAATLKGLVLGTASEAGAFPGPDYIFGWGLMNTEKAAKAIIDNGAKSLISEKILSQGATETFNVIASGDGPLVATICWTDPEIDVIPVANALNNPTLRLVNDLDIRCTDGNSTYFPWILDPSRPAAAAATGDNFRDNVEQIFIANAVPGKTYTFKITHKNTLQRGPQAFSAIFTGVGGNTYCTSSPVSSADSKITGFSLADVNYQATSGCTIATDLTSQTIGLELGKTYPLSIALGTCGANFNKIAKVFIDWNADGDFNDDNELVATSGVVNGAGVFNANITVPSNLNKNSFTLLRVVLVETNNANDVLACGSYAKGETLNYRVNLLGPSTDVGISNIVAPVTSCANSQQTVTVIIRNSGTQAVANVPVTVEIKEGSISIATLSGNYTGSIKPGDEQQFLIPGTYVTQAGKTYSISAKTLLANDFIPANDAYSTTQQVSVSPAIGNVSAVYCNNTNEYQLNANGDGTIFWYANSNSLTPIAYGNNISTSVAPVDGKYYAALNQFTASVGPKDKYEARLGSGTYLQTTGDVYVTTAAPLILESAKLYIGNPGAIRFSVKNSLGIEVSNTKINVTATRSVAMPNNSPNDLTDQGSIYNLNLVFPAAGKYTISTEYENGATIFRNNEVSEQIYPIKSDLSIFTITGNNASTPASYYYYFYDTKIKALGCASPRTEVALVKPEITKTGDELSSNFTNQNQWYLNGDLIPGATGQKYKPLKAGKYSLRIKTSSGCEMITADYYFLPNARGESAINLQVFPIPVSNKLNVAFEVNEVSNLRLGLFNIIGQPVYEIQKSNQKGVIVEQIDVSHLAKGTYILKLNIGGQTFTKKIVVI